MKKITLDTNAYSALSQGVSPARQAIEYADQVFIPVFVLAELLFGFKKVSREQENTTSLNDFMKLPGVSFLFPGAETARIYAHIMLTLKEKGKPLPTHNIWIAACAIEAGSVIVTYDKHFLHIPQARVWDEL